MLSQIEVQDQIRRQLHNRLMQLSGNINFFVRVRPILPHEVNGFDIPFSFPSTHSIAAALSLSVTATTATDLTKSTLLVIDP